MRGLDWFIFFLADVQTGFGPFIAVYLTSQKWTQVDIGLVLSIGALTSLIAQIPGGWIVDAAKSERLVAALALVAISASALAYAFLPMFPVVLSAALLHAIASCVLGPCVAAISLGLVGHAGMARRLGRNARFASVGNGLAAAFMGAIGYAFSPHAVFIVTAVLLLPTLAALSRIQPVDIDPDRAHGETPEPEHRHAHMRAVLGKSSLFILAGCVMLFHLANSALLPLMGSAVTARSSQWATLLIAACIVVPQAVVAVISPWIGRRAQVWGRRPFVLAAFAALALRALLLAVVQRPELLVLVQALDGITAASLGVMVPLMIADITRGTGRFNLSQGFVGAAIGIGATISPTLAGYLADRFNATAAFAGLGCVAALALLFAWRFLPETKPR